MLERLAGLQRDGLQAALRHTHAQAAEGRVAFGAAKETYEDVSMNYYVEVRAFPTSSTVSHQLPPAPTTASRSAPPSPQSYPSTRTRALPPFRGPLPLLVAESRAVPSTFMQVCAVLFLAHECGLWASMHTLTTTLWTRIYECGGEWQEAFAALFGR